MIIINKDNIDNYFGYEGDIKRINFAELLKENKGVLHFNITEKFFYRVLGKDNSDEARFVGKSFVNMKDEKDWNKREKFFNEFKFSDNDLKDQITEINIIGDTSENKEIEISGCFIGLRNLERVNFEGNIYFINRSFKFCEKLKEINFNGCFNKIHYSFNDLHSLKEITIQYTIREMFDSFVDCKNLSNIVFEKEKYGMKLSLSHSFSRLQKLEEITIDDRISSINIDTFSFCNNLKNINFKNGTNLSKGIRIDGFSNCRSLKKINFPDYLINISRQGFNNCENLEEIHFNETSKLSGLGGFYSCEKLKKIKIPKFVEWVYGFNFCKSLNEISFYDNSGCEIINGFEYCNSLENVTISKSIKEVGASCFLGCKNLKSVIFEKGSRLKKINGLFDVKNLKYLELQGTANLLKHIFDINSLTIKVNNENNEKFTENVDNENIKTLFINNNIGTVFYEGEEIKYKRNVKWFFGIKSFGKKKPVQVFKLSGLISSI